MYEITKILLAKYESLKNMNNSISSNNNTIHTKYSKKFLKDTMKDNTIYTLTDDGSEENFSSNFFIYIIIHIFLN